MRKQILSLLVENTAGVTSHISGLFSRRGYNIDSFSSGVTADPKYTRITIVASGEEQILEQIEKQLEKLVDVLDIKELKPDESVYRELALIKVSCPPSERPNLISLAGVFRANVIDTAKDGMIIEMTGNQGKINAFLKLIDCFEILELARTGIAGLRRGTDDIVYPQLD